MSAHITDEIPRLLSGEAAHDTVLEAAQHLRACPDCHEELVAALVAHASLASAHRFAPEVVARDTADLFTAAEDPAALPDLSTVFARARAEATSPTAKVKATARSAARGPLRTRYLAVAAAAAVIVGGGATGIVLSQSSSGPATSQVALSAYGVGHTPGSASISSSGSLTVDAASLPHVTGQRYEIWLTDAARSSMKPVGWLDSDGRAQLTVPGDLVGTYSYIEVSQQAVSSASYAYSGKSVLRGKYSV